MKTKFYLLSLALAAILPVSCSQDTALNPELQAETGCMSFNITLDCALTSRAGETDPLPTRCLLEVYEGATNKLVGKQQSTTGSISFSISVANLEKGKEYTFVFWADGGEDTYNTGSLTAITPKKDNAIAFSGKTTTAVESGKTVSVILSHVVAKLSLVHSADINLIAGDQVMVQFTQQKYSFNALSGSYSTTETQEVNHTHPVTADKTNGEIFSLYMLAPNDEMMSGGDKSMMVSDFKLGFQAKDATSSHSKEIPNVTFKANHRTVITGNIRDISFDTQKISVSLNQNWGEDIIPTPDEGGQQTEPEEPKQPEEPTPVTPVTPGNSTISLTSAGTLTDSQIQSALANGNDLKITGSMNDVDFTTLKTYLLAHSEQNVKLDISETAVTTIPFEAFYKCENLIGITLSSSVTTIGEYAFAETGISEIIANGVTILEAGAFRKCPNLTTASFGDLKSVEGTIFFESKNISTIDLTRCTATFTNKNSFFSSGQTVTIYVNEELIIPFKTIWDNYNFNITWTTK